ncbi:MAG: serine/threonine protein phosphatase [Rhodobacteraceae bacterium]|nr:serine/threonine protein phosphatase [Paracoccaceae bacterium]
MRTYAIGDIHGYLDQLDAAHRLIAEDRARVGDRYAPVIHIGDLVDRGPDSRGVIARLHSGILKGEPWIVLKGNHDRMFISFLLDPDDCDPGTSLHWTHPRIGGAETLASYGVRGAEERPRAEVYEEVLDAIPADHATFLNGLRTAHLRGGTLFVHAGIRPGVPLADQREDDLLWIRGTFHDDRRDHGVLVVHGHTPVAEVTHYGNRVNIDTGAGYGKDVATVVIEDGRVWQLVPGGRRAIRREG